jgi:TetR/AcrR family transcriptional repressor of nem operon
MGRTSDARERLLDAAFELIWTNSYGAVGVDQICERADVRKGSFYHYFPSKADLAMATFEDQWSKRRPDLDALFSPMVPPLTRLEQWCTWIRGIQIAMAERFGQVCGCPFVNVGMELGTQDARVRSQMSDFFERARQYLQSAIQDAMDSGAIPRGDAQQLAGWLHALSLGFQVQAKVANDTAPMADLRTAMRQLLGAPAAHQP